MNTVKRKRFYTLVELLVAMAILVIMMGFLFQFVIGAQRVWSGTKRQASSFEYSQVVFDVIGSDLNNMLFSSEPGRTMPFYLHRQKVNEGSTTYHNVFMAFFTDFKSSSYTSSREETTVGTFPVIYYFNEKAGKIYRCAIDDTHFKKNGENFTINKIWYLYGAEYGSDNDFFGAFCHRVLDTSSETDLSNLDQFDLLAEHVTDFKVDVMFGNEEDEKEGSAKSFDPSETSDKSKHYAAVKPQVVRIRMKIDNVTDENKQEVTERSFSKVIFL